jgi:hypothetical protein
MLIYYLLYSRALGGSNKISLLVIWRANKKSWVKQDVFEDWFKSYFCTTVEKHCKQNNLLFKALFVFDNASGHSTALNDLCKNIKVVFLPPNTLCYSQWNRA